MSLRRELGKIEEAERAEGQDEIELIRREETADKITGLYHRIDVIVEYIDNQKGVTTITEQQLKEDEQHFREEGIRKAWELKNLELELKIKGFTEVLEERNRKESISRQEIERLKEVEYELKSNQFLRETKEDAYKKGFEEGVNYTMMVIKETREEPKSLKREPQTASREKPTEGVKEKDKIGSGLGKAVGDV